MIRLSDSASSPTRPTPRRLLHLTVLPALAVMMLASDVRAQQVYKFAPFNNPLGPTLEGNGINNKVQVAGTYTEAGTGLQQGFLKSGNVFTKISPRGAVNGTQAKGINDQGQVVGVSFDLLDHAHAFLFSGGVITTFNAPKGVNGTQANAINNQGQIAGSYSDVNGLDQGFLLSKGVYTTISHPNGAFGTRIRSINNNGDMVGEFTDSHSRTHGFLLSRGVFTTIDFPNASFTQLSGINDHGDMTGNTFGFVNGGFVLSRGVFTPLLDDEPTAGGINNDGQVVGQTDGLGFIATPVSKKDDHGKDK
jgi:probable HAF family extracellular repeat protein